METVSIADAFPPCPYCQAFHAGKCALVKAFEYHPDGTIKRVEFYAPCDYVPAIFANPAPQNTPDISKVRFT